jgi:hypothetical protein
MCQSQYNTEKSTFNLVLLQFHKKKWRNKKFAQQN